MKDPLALQVLLVWTLFAVGLMGWDKTAARSRSRRIPEKFLFTVALLFGGLGIWIGMYLFRHKTLHKTFVIGAPLLTVLNFLVLYKMGLLF